jgi:ABC-type multidrug transport system fused ATPase/permease subunit
MPDSSPKKPSSLRRVLSLFYQERRKEFYFLGSLSIASTVLAVGTPFITQKLVDTLINFFKNGGAIPTLTFVLSIVGILALTLLQRFNDSTYDYNLFKTVTGFEDWLRDQSIRKYLDLHALFHHSVSSGQIMSRLERGATATYVVLNELIGKSLVPSILLILGITVAVAIKSWIVALIIILPLPLYVFLTRKIINKIYEVEKESNEAYELAAKEAYDISGNVQTVKKFAQEAVEADGIKAKMITFRKIQYSGEKLWALLDNIQAGVGVAGQIGVIIYAGFSVFAGRHTIGEFVLFVTLQNMAYGPIGRLSQSIPRLRRNLTRVDRLFGVLDEQVHISDLVNAPNLKPLADTIEYRNVSFSYHNDTRWSLKNVHVSIPAGSTVALVGRSGSGKTTFVNLLLRSFDPQHGGIFIDGVDIRTVTQKSLRDQIAVVPQDVDLFSRTISENIAYGQTKPSRELIEQAATTALAHDFIVKTEQGYDTTVGERGVKLSGGERQRIGIARAILRDPKILILDEATSHLDSESEKLITKATDALIKNRTTVIIAHRLSTVLKADMILVFNQGTIEAAGPHKELLKTSKTYKKLYELQFGD